MQFDANRMHAALTKFTAEAMREGSKGKPVARPNLPERALELSGLGLLAHTVVKGAVVLSPWGYLLPTVEAARSMPAAVLEGSTAWRFLLEEVGVALGFASDWQFQVGHVLVGKVSQTSCVGMLRAIEAQLARNPIPSRDTPAAGSPPPVGNMPAPLPARPGMPAPRASSQIPAGLSRYLPALVAAAISPKLGVAVFVGTEFLNRRKEATT
jgi:hypothetical protein